VAFRVLNITRVGLTFYEIITIPSYSKIRQLDQKLLEGDRQSERLIWSDVLRPCAYSYFLSFDSTLQWRHNSIHGTDDVPSAEVTWDRHSSCRFSKNLLSLFPEKHGGRITTNYQSGKNWEQDDSIVGKTSVSDCRTEDQTSHTISGITDVQWTLRQDLHRSNWQQAIGLYIHTKAIKVLVCKNVGE
jgi:hypothetical protein